MWIVLMVVVGLGFAVLHVIPPAARDGRRQAESSFWRSTTWAERVRLNALAKRLPGEAGSIASHELRQLEATTRTEFVSPRRVRVATRGPRDLCLVDLPDGSTLRLTVFDGRSAARFAATWSPEADLGVRLRFVTGVGWQCTLQTDSACQADRSRQHGSTAVATVYGWLAEIDRSHLAANEVR